MGADQRGVQEAIARFGREAAIAAPAWLPLPSTPFISSIEQTGNPGNEAAFGTVNYDLPSDGGSEVNWLKQHLAANGYELDDRTSAIDNFGGADAVVSATDPASGRRVTFVNVRRLDGANLRVTFEDPQAERDTSSL